jgi:hypothetical protein
MQFGPHQDTQVVLRELEQLCRRIPVDEVMLFMYAEEQCDGHPTLEQVAQWLDALRPWKLQLERIGLRVSLNPWTVLGVCDRGRRLKAGQNWQTMVDWKGRSAQLVVCPLDAAWQEYFKSAITLMAAERYRVIWIEDDYRYHNHEPLDWGGCFCDLHVAEFSRRANTHATREEIVRAMLLPGRPHPWRQIWLDLWQDNALELLAQWRDVAQAQGTQLGLMSSGIEAHAIEGRRWRQWWKALAGTDKPPIHRPHFWSYGDTGGKAALAESIAVLDQNRRLEPPGAEVGPEIECFPYYSWNKSYAQTAAQMYLATIFGSTNLNVSLYDFMGNLPSDDPERAEFLGRLKPALSRMRELFPPTLQSSGVGVVWREDASRRIHTAGKAQWMDLNCPTRPWAVVLASMGVGYAMADQSCVNALSGTMAWALDDSEIESLLSRGLFLDGLAAHILDQRGFGPQIGLTDTRLVNQDEITYSMEEFTDADFALRPGSQASLNVGIQYLVQGNMPTGAKTISQVLDAVQGHVAHGAVLFENALGGRVAVTPYDISQQSFWSLQRMAQLRRVLAWLARGKELGRVEGEPWLIPQFLTDGSHFRAVLWNAGFDPVQKVTLHVPNGWPKLAKGLLFSASGEVTEFSCGDTPHLPHPLRQWAVATMAE